MSLICLSSRGVSDRPENFSNYFGGRGIEFGKNSEICLVGASIKKQCPIDDVDGTLTITAENNTFACHYGTSDGANENLFRDDIFVIPPQTVDVASMELEISRVAKDQCTISPLRYGYDKSATPTGADITAAVGLTLKADMWENQGSLPGYWAEPNNLPYAQEMTITDAATASSLDPGPSLVLPCFMQDSRKLWNTDNQATVADPGPTHLYGARYQFSYTGGVGSDPFDGMQGGIVTGNRVGGVHKDNSWVNLPVDTIDEQPQMGLYEQQIDLGWSIEGGQLCIYKNEFAQGGYSRRYLTRVLVPVIAGATAIDILFRPLNNGGNYGWEALYNIAGAGFVVLPYIPGTDAGGNFPMGLYNGNQSESGNFGIGLNCVMAWGKNNTARVRVLGTYDNEGATVVAPAAAFGKRIQWGMSYLSDTYAPATGAIVINPDFRTLCQTRCNIASEFGFYAGKIHLVSNMLSTGLVSDKGIGLWLDVETPYCIQLPNLPISGYLGGGASNLGGATEAPIIGIVDSYTLDSSSTRTFDPSPNTISSPYNDNWIKLQNRDSFMVNELQVRITDLYGVLPTNLGGPSHVWIKLRSNDGSTAI